MATKNLSVLYRTDAKHNKSSYELVGIFESKDKAIKTIRPIIEGVCSEDFKDAGYISSEDFCNDCIDNLKEFNQTQTLIENYVIETVILNELSL